jgi:SAM-dependent methyltransferase
VLATEGSRPKAWMQSDLETMENGYGDPTLYDAAFSGTAKWEVDNILEVARREGIECPAPTLEVACGSGRILYELAARKFACFGYDSHPGMLSLAVEKFRRLNPGTRPQVRLADMATFETERRFALAMSLANSICHLLEDAAVVQHLQHTEAALMYGGRYVVELCMAFADPRNAASISWNSQHGNVEVNSTWTIVSENKEIGRSIQHNRIEGLGRSAHLSILDVHVLRAWTMQEWRHVVQRAGLQIYAIYDRQLNKLEPDVELFGEDDNTYFVLGRRSDCIRASGRHWPAHGRAGSCASCRGSAIAASVDNPRGVSIDAHARKCAEKIRRPWASGFVLGSICCGAGDGS